MINQIEVPAIIEEILPELKEQIQQTVGRKKTTIYIALQCMADFTRKMIQANNYTMVRRCLLLASKLHADGSQVVRNAIENVYVYSFSRLLVTCETYHERNMVQAVIPACTLIYSLSQAGKRF